MFPFGLFLNPTFRSYHRAIRPKPSPGSKAGRCHLPSSRSHDGSNPARGEWRHTICLYPLLLQRQWALAPGLRGVVVQTLPSVFGSNRTGKCTPVTEGLSHPQNDLPSEASSHRFCRCRMYNTPFRGGGARLCNQTHERPAAAAREQALLVRRCPPPGVEPAGAFFWLSCTNASHHRWHERYYGRGHTVTVRHKEEYPRHARQAPAITATGL